MTCHGSQPGRRRVAGIVITLAGLAPAAVAASGASDLGPELVALLRLPAAAGRERPAAAFLRERLAKLPVRSDAQGNLSVALGSGQPRRLILCPLTEPGFVVREISGNGYLRLALPADAPFAGTLWVQAHEGQVVWVAGARGEVPGVVAAPSIHLQPHAAPAAPPAPPFALADAFVDVGAEDAAQATGLGIRTGDPVTLDRRPVRLGGDLIAGPSARMRAACLAAAEAARRLHAAPGGGTATFAWTVQDSKRRPDFDELLRQYGPVSSIVVLGRDFGWQPSPDGRPRPAALPAPGTGLLAAGALADKLAGTQTVPYLLAPPRGNAVPAPDPWTDIGYLGLPALYPGTPVETISLADTERLTSALLCFLGHPPGSKAPHVAAVNRTTRPAPPPRAASSRPAPASPSPLSETVALLGELVARYGVSGNEAAVRGAIAARLPTWAHPTVDWAGNLSVTVGAVGTIDAARSRDPANAAGGLLFMAHMDEIGFRVGAVLADGRLELQPMGGLQSSLWEAQPALVHGHRGPVPAVFEPRPDWLTASRRSPARGLTLFLGYGLGLVPTGPARIAALGVQAGATVTMPKTLLRLGRDRVTARSLDDRAGAAVLLLALRRLDPTRLARLGRVVTFAWTSREEIGYLGAAALAHRLGGRRRVFPVDAFPTADSPRESHRAAYAPLGRGAVVPANAPPALLAQLLDLGRRRGIALQPGIIAGGNDGVPFQAGDAAVLPLGWPCRYTHTPVEVADLRDLEALVDLVVALAGGGS